MFRLGWLERHDYIQSQRKDEKWRERRECMWREYLNSSLNAALHSYTHNSFLSVMSTKKQATAYRLEQVNLEGCINKKQERP